uniref:Venom metalloproteinase inhibitor DM43b n=1 Tax=Didelphis marsupialis TaxID=9268 RepID=Q8HYX5_DIDMR|nr:venom metalloproteinase inhibitor DM43b precursor [Didelphis marsupialis]
MAVPLVLLFLLGLWLDPKGEVDALKAMDTTPRLWIETESTSTPWTNVTLQCVATSTQVLSFQLWKDGVLFSNLSPMGPVGKFWLGPVTADNRGIYRCQTLTSGHGWSSLSAPAEVTGKEPLPAPSLRAEPGPWILRGVETKLYCRGVLMGMIFDLYQEGEQEPVKSSQTPGTEATFIVNSTGNYSCLYQAPAPVPSVNSTPSEIIHVVIPDFLPKANIYILNKRNFRPGDSVSFSCQARFSEREYDLEFKLFKDGQETPAEVVLISNPMEVFLELEAVGPEDGGKYSCRYRFSNGPPIWSEDSNVVELVVSTGQ